MGATLLKSKAYFQDNAIDPEFIRAHETLATHGPRHVPISHALVLEKFRSKCEANGLMLMDERGALSRNGEKYMYVAEVVPEVADEDFRMAVGFRSFNDESSVFQMSCGANVLLCSNGMQTSVIIPSKRKHTATIHDLLDSRIDAGLETFRNDSEVTKENIALMKSIPYSDDILGKLIIALGRTGQVGNTNIMKILSEVDKPSYNSKDDSTVWRIMNACTTVTTHRMANPIQSMNTSKLMHDTLMKIIKPDYKPLGEVIDMIEAE